MAGNKGRDDQGQFTENSEAASRAGRKGGRTAQQKGTAHELTQEERSRGGKRSQRGNRSE